MTLIVACGLKREARIVARGGGDLFAVIGGGDAVRLDADLDATAAARSGIILSCGIAGALVPELEPGDVVIDGDTELVERLRHALPDARRGAVIGHDIIVATAARKRALHEQTRALAVDMESHVAARVAGRRGLPFAALRVISDRMEDDLPPAALIGMRPDGGMALGAVLASLARDPRQLPALIRTGRQAERAFTSLERAVDQIIRAGIDRIELSQR